MEHTNGERRGDGKVLQTMKKRRKKNKKRKQNGHSNSSDIPPPSTHQPSQGYPSLSSYWTSQVTPRDPFAISEGENVARVRVYNTLFRVPYHLERFIWVGVLNCFDTLLTRTVMVPCRLMMRYPSMDAVVLFDVLCAVAMMTGVYVHAMYLEPGMLYFGMKDVTAEFLKISLLYVALDVADKILSNVGVDVMRMLMESCQSYCLSQRHLLSLAFDALLFSIVAWVHSLVVMSIAMVWYVSMESDRAILAFMIVSNFGEIKTTVFKRFDSEKLFVLCRTDVVERLNLLLAAVFIVVEDWGQIGDWTINPEILYKCGSILILESIVDIIKHSVVVNFNNIPSGIYRTYLSDHFQKVLENHGDATVEALVFEPIGPAILFLRVLTSALSIGDRSRCVQCSLAAVIALLLLAWKVIIGWSLQLGAEWYLQYSKSHERKQL